MMAACSTTEVAPDPQAYAMRLRAQSDERMIPSQFAKDTGRALDQLRLDLGSSQGMEAGAAPPKPAERGNTWLSVEAWELLPSKPITITLKDSTLRQVVWILGKELGVNLMLSDAALGLKQKANINLVQVDARDALLDVLKTFDVCASVGSGKSLLLKTEAVQAFHLDPNLSRSSFQSNVGGDLLGATKDAALRHQKQTSDEFGVKADGFESFAKLIEVILAEEMEVAKAEGRAKPSMAADKVKGIVFVRARPSRVRGVQRLIDQVMESSTKQMDIDAQIIEVELSDQHQFGIDWNLLSRHVAGAIGATEVSIPSVKQSGSGSLIPTVMEFAGLKAGSTTGGSGLLVSNNSVAATVNAIRSFGNVKVVASPTVRLRSGTVSNVTVGEVIRFIQSSQTSTSPQGGEPDHGDHRVIVQRRGIFRGRASRGHRTARNLCFAFPKPSG